MPEPPRPGDRPLHSSPVLSHAPAATHLRLTSPVAASAPLFSVYEAAPRFTFPVSRTVRLNLAFLSFFSLAVNRILCRTFRLAPGLALGLTLGLALSGCAVPGEPTPRRPVVPAALRDLAARQQGDAVVLTFTLPRDSSAQKPLAETPAVDIYRGTPPTGSGVPAVANAAPSAAAPSSSPQSPGPPSKNSPAAASSPALRLIHTIPGDTVNTYEHDGKVEFRDALDPAELARLPGESLAYQVRTRVTANHASAPSNSVTLQVYPAPQAVLGVQAMVTEQAILLSWTPPASTTGADSAKIVGYHVYRGEIDPGSAAAGEASATKPIFRAPLALLAESAGPAYRDERFEFGRTYFYIVRSVAQWNTVAVESADPRPAIVTATDVFPPAAPQQLEIVVTPATPEAGSSIELAWAISPEPDLEGYEVYRSEQPDTVGERLNSELLPAPTFRDMTVAPAHQYFYRIRAVDRAGNESAFSAAVAARIPGAGP